MTQGERVKEVRKTLGLTLEKFGEKIGIQKSAVSKIEKGENSLTDSNIKAICREFAVDYRWLTTGQGEMFVDDEKELLDMIKRILLNNDEFYKRVLKWCLCSLSHDELKLFEKNIDKFLADIKKEV